MQPQKTTHRSRQLYLFESEPDPEILPTLSRSQLIELQESLVHSPRLSRLLLLIRGAIDLVMRQERAEGPDVPCGAEIAALALPDSAVQRSLGLQFRRAELGPAGIELVVETEVPGLAEKWTLTLTRSESR